MCVKERERGRERARESERESERARERERERERERARERARERERERESEREREECQFLRLYSVIFKRMKMLAIQMLNINDRGKQKDFNKILSLCKFFHYKSGVNPRPPR